MPKITVPVTNTTITSLWGKSVADNINALPELYGGRANFTTDATGLFSITFATALSWTPTWGILQLFGTDTVARVSSPVINGLSPTQMSGLMVDLRNPATGVLYSNAFVGLYIVGATRP